LAFELYGLFIAGLKPLLMLIILTKLVAAFLFGYKLEQKSHKKVVCTICTQVNGGKSSSLLVIA